MVPGHRPVGLNEEFTLTVGGSARVGETGMLIRFDSVLEDSRCPAAVNCIWEGNARVKIYVVAPTGRPGAKLDLNAVPVELNTSGRFERRGAIDPGFIELRALSPRPPIRDPQAYAATLFIEVPQ